MLSSLLDVNISGLDKSRYIKQLKGVILWKNNKGRGTLHFSRGVGKTLAGIIAIKKVQKRDINRNCIIIVPTQPLKGQWEKELNKYNIINTKVFVINSALLIDISCNLLILDEIHLYASNERLKIFNINYNWILGLTGTFERLDGKHTLIEKYAPICCEITHENAVKSNYILDVKIYNLAIPLAQKDKLKINNYSIELVKALKFFDSFEEMLKCLKKENAIIYANDKNLDYKLVQKTANYGNYSMRNRKKILQNSESKLNNTIEILKFFKNKKILTFGLNTNTCDTLTNILSDESISYHYNIEGTKVKIQQEKLYKTLKGVENAKTKIPYSKYIKTKDGFLLKWNKLKTLNKEKTLESIITRFKNNNSKLRIINTALSLKQGFSVNELEIVVVYDRTSSFADFDQIKDRACRLYDNKYPIMINLYHPNTQDEKWLRNAQKNCDQKNIEWIESINQIKFKK